MIKVTFTDEIEIITSTEHLYQWDVGQILEIDGLNVGTPIIHFGVKGDTTGYGVQSQIVDGKLRCGIPDTVLQSGKQIIAYIYVSAGASKYTDRVILIPVIERNKPSNYRTVNMDEVTETQSFFDSMVERLDSLEKRVPISFWTGTEEEYNDLTIKTPNCLYITTDGEDNEKLMKLIDKSTAVLWEGAINEDSTESERTLTIPNSSKYGLFALEVSIYPENHALGYSMLAYKQPKTNLYREETGTEMLQGSYCEVAYAGAGVTVVNCTLTFDGDTLKLQEARAVVGESVAKLYLRRLIGVC